MEKYVVTRELADELLDAGYPQAQSQFLWVRRPDGAVWFLTPGRNYTKYMNFDYDMVDTPLSDELLEQLKELEPAIQVVSNPSQDALYNSVKTMLGKTTAFVPFMRMGDYPSADKPADALARLWLWCKAEGYLEIGKS